MVLTRSRTVQTSLGFALVALVCLLFADLQVRTAEPWGQVGQLLGGLIQPDFSNAGEIGWALLRTVAFGFVGVGLAAVAGALLALVFQWRIVRLGCAFVRAIHELFWALIFLQIFGMHPITGVLAIAIPFAGAFGKVYAEIMEETDPGPARALPHGTGLISTFAFTWVPQAWPHLRAYTSYRLECALRSSAVLGFVGLPTLGYHLDSAFSESAYGQVGALLLTFYVLIGTLRYWALPRLVPVYLAAAPFFLGTGLPIVWGNVERFFTEDIVPRPLRQGEGFAGLADWLGDVLLTQALPGVGMTVVLTQIALVVTAVLALMAFPLISRHFTTWRSGTVGHLILVVARSTPEYLLAFVLLHVLGPSMLPAVIALAVHNAGIIGYLIGRRSNEIHLRPDAANGLNRYAFEILPRAYGPFLAFLLYRWEIIMRETAILGILGIATLGFYVDNAIHELRFDTTVVLLLVTAALNMGVDAFARYVRRRLHLRHTPDAA